MKHRLKFTIKKLFRMALLLLGVSLTAFLLMDEIGRASCRERV